MKFKTKFPVILGEYSVGDAFFGSFLMKYAEFNQIKQVPASIANIRLVENKGNREI